MAYRVRLPPQLAAIHNIFHIYQLKKCIRISTEFVEQKEIFIQPDLSYIEYPIKVFDQKGQLGKSKLSKSKFPRFSKFAQRYTHYPL
jgi:hypothetical protein